MRSAIILIAIWTVPAIAFSATINIPADYPTIQDAIDAAVNGDTVLVAPGTYVENIDFKGKAITVTSEQGSDVTIIDGDQMASVVTFQSGEGPGSVLEGFTLTNGFGNNDPSMGSVGGGVYCFQSSPLITGCTIKENSAGYYGGGIYCGDDANPAISTNLIIKNIGGWGGGGGIFCRESTPDISSNIITGNSFDYQPYESPPGGGIYLINSNPSITNNVIMGNDAWNGGGMYNDNSRPTVTNCTFTGNSGVGGGGMYNYESSPMVTNCTFSGNRGGGMYNQENSNPTVTNCILWNDSPDEIYNDLCSPIVTYSCVQGGYPGMGNIDSDPLFLDPGYWDDNDTPGNPDDDFWVDGDYHLTFSPCIDVGDNNAPGIPNYDFEGDPRIFDGDGDGTAVVDMGCDEAITLHVPKDFQTIQAAINAAAYRESIVVWPGTYFENIDFLGKAITVAGVQGPDATMIDSSHVGNVVTFQNGEGKHSLLIGFTLTNGAAPDGGGIYCLDSSPTLKDIKIIGNSSTSGIGGGIYCSNSSPLIENSIISQNVSSSSGGGVYCYDSSPTLKEIEITGNTSTNGDGGGICCSDSSPLIENSIISQNVSSSSGGGVYCYDSSPTLKEIEITGNTSTNGDGGGIYCSDSSPLIENSIISQNVSSSSSGGGAFCLDSSPILVNTRIYGNSAFLGGGISSDVGSFPVITNSIIYENSASNEGGGVFCGNGSPTITNSIVWQNNAPVGSQIQGTNPVVTYCDVEGGWPGAGNINADPLFLDPGMYNFHLTVESPCINWGDNYAPEIPDSDFEGDLRIVYGTVDMGVDEYTFGGGVFIRVPKDFPTIQEAINNALKDDIVLVDPGVYFESIDFKGKEIAVKSSMGPDVTTVNGISGKWVVSFTKKEGHNSILKGFTITNGTGGISCDKSNPTIQDNNITGNTGRGISCNDSNPTIQNNDITGNTGGAISCSHSNPTIEDNNIAGNTTSNNGGGIHCDNSTATIINNIITGNSASVNGGGIYCENSTVTLMNNIIAGNSVSVWGGGICCYNSSLLTITNSTITENSASTGGGIFAWLSSTTVTNSILWNNNGGELTTITGSATISYCDIMSGYPGTGNIDSDPLFVDPNNGDFHLTYPSPCKDTGDNSAVIELTDFEGDPRIAYGTVDMGADEFYTHLYWTGDATPGGNVALKFIGLPGTTPVQLWLGSGVIDPPMTTKYGDWWLQFPLLADVGLGSITSPEGVLVLPFTLPSTTPAPIDLPFQAGIGMELTNLSVMVVE